MTRSCPIARLAAAVLCLALAGRARAEEGMWLFNDFPSAAVEKAYGFHPTPEWLDKVRLGSARLAGGGSGGCSASFVSPHGLVMTNHHCVRSCIEDLASAGEDLLENGFFARAPEEERRCEKIEANQLLEIRDVTVAVRKVTAGKDGAAFHAALKAEKARLEKECASGPQARCDVVTLFHGGAYHLYRYRRFQDVRLAFAPEFPTAAFGGYPDNFNFPRYGFDVSFLRIYEDGVPVKTPDHLRWSSSPAKEGDLVFVSGNPGGTERVQTAEQLAFQRDVALPEQIAGFAESRGLLLQFQEGDPERFRIARAKTRSVENALKALRGRHAFLADEAFFARKAREDRELREKVRAEPTLAAKYDRAWDGIAAALRTHRRIFIAHRFEEGTGGFQSELFDHARILVRAAIEREKPNGERLREYADAQLPTLEQHLLHPVPIHGAIEELTLASSMRRLREALGTDHPFVRKVLGRESPESVARASVRGSLLADAKVRRALYAGGRAAIESSRDPMIRLARIADDDARAVRRIYEEQVESALAKNGELLSQSYVAVHGTEGYPDATFTPRLSYGQVKGWRDEDREVPAMTVVGGLYERHTGQFPFAVAPTWLRARQRIDAALPMNMATTNDIIGGNSGSPAIDRQSRVVGVIFDGNLPSLGGRYGYEPARNRAIAVHGDIILSALRIVYGADRIADEIAPRGGGAPGSR